MDSSFLKVHHIAFQQNHQHIELSPETLAHMWMDIRRMESAGCGKKKIARAKARYEEAKRGITFLTDQRVDVIFTCAVAHVGQVRRLLGQVFEHDVAHIPVKSWIGTKIEVDAQVIFLHAQSVA